MASCGVLPNPSTSDEQLAQSVRDGDDRAFELLYRRYRDPLCRYAGRLLRDAPAGEDAAQVALTNAYRALRAGQVPRSLRPWLYRIARNAAWGLRTERDVVELPAALEARPEAPAGDTAALTAAVAQLPERQRAVFALRELRGASNRETAEVLGLRESQVEQLLFAGRARLAELLLFGDSVSCAAVRAAATIQLGRHERRAFKRHAHHCAECRTLLGGRLKLGARLVAPLDALRRLAELFIGAAGPAKASVAAAVAIAVSAPLVLPEVSAVGRPVHRPTQVAVVPATHRVEAKVTPVRAAVRPSPVKPRERGRRVPSRPAPSPPPVSTERVAATPAQVPVTHAPPLQVRPAPEPQRPTVAPATRAPATTTRTAVAPVVPLPAAKRAPSPTPRTPTAQRDEPPIAPATPAPSAAPGVPTPRDDSTPMIVQDRGLR